MPNQLEIKELLKKISQKDEKAFAVFFEWYYPRLVQIALAYVPGVVAAQEVVSDLFFKIIKNPKTIGLANDLDNYIFLAVKNQCLTYLKKNRHRQLSDHIDHKEDYIIVNQINPESSMISEELYSQIQLAVNSLPPKRKAVFLLVKEEGKKYREVAEILNISIKTVELHMSLATKKIKELVQYYQDSKDVKVINIGGETRHK
ncbi:MAG: RNA polymerase sigma-70 factor [Cyclobacteriaceae bacterium]|nr:RNA polymerase sigma-70 factor [Cyclobacteriaceae bacterium]